MGFSINLPFLDTSMYGNLHIYVELWWLTSGFFPCDPQNLQLYTLGARVAVHVELLHCFMLLLFIPFITTQLRGSPVLTWPSWVCINEVPNWDAHEIQVLISTNQLAELLAPSVILMGNPSFRGFPRGTGDSTVTLRRDASWASPTARQTMRIEYWHVCNQTIRIIL